MSKVTREISKMEVGLNELNCKLASLTLEYSNKSRELFARQLDLDRVIRMTFEINSSLMYLNLIPVNWII